MAVGDIPIRVGERTAIHQTIWITGQIIVFGETIKQAYLAGFRVAAQHNQVRHGAIGIVICAPITFSQEIVRPVDLFRYDTI